MANADNPIPDTLTVRPFRRSIRGHQKRMRPRARTEGEGWSWHQDTKAKLSPGADFARLFRAVAT